MIYFPHIPKAGGTTLKRMFDRNLGAGKCIGIWDKRFGADFNADEFPSVDVSSIKEGLALYGHLNIRTALDNKHIAHLDENGELLIISAVRDPIDRIISLFNYMRVTEKHPSHKYILSLGLDGFEKIIGHP